jgi:hypothetical protein
MIKKNTIKLFALSVAAVSMIFLNSCGKDDEGITPISIDFSSATATVAEDGGAQTVTVLFDSNAPIDATYDVTISGDAVYGEDYTTSPDGTSGSATIAVSAGDESSTFQFTPIDNDNVDGDKTVIFTISGSAEGIKLGTSLTYTVTIDDEEGLSNIDFATAENTVSEDAGELTITLNFGTTTTAPGTVEVTLTGDASAVTSDPAAVADVITVTSTSGVDNVTFTVTPVNDTEYAADRVITFTLGNATNGIELGASQQTYVLTVTEDDPNTIASLRAEFEANGSSTLTGGRIQGVVITDKSNITGRNMVVQDASGGIVVRFNDSNVDFDLGDEVSVDLTDAELTDFSGLIQISGLELTAVTDKGAGTLPTPTSVTIAELLTDDYQSQLVTVTDVAIEGADGEMTFGSFQTETLVNIGGDKVNTFVRGGSSLENEIVPVGVGSVTGAATLNSGVVELIMRSTADLDLTEVATLSIVSTENNFGQLENGVSKVETHSVTVATGALLSDVTVSAGGNFSVSLDGVTFTEELTLTSASITGSTVDVSVRFLANTGFNGVISGVVSYESFGVNKAIIVEGEEIGNAVTSVLLAEDFDYGTTEGAFVDGGTGIGASSWEAHSGSGDTYTYQNSSLSFTGYGSTGVGGSVVSGTGEDINRDFQSQSSGTVYAAALVNVASAASTSGDYFMHLKTSETFDYWSRVMVQDDGAGNLLFGIREKSGTTVYSSANYTYGTTYVVVFTYNFTSGQSELHVMTSVPATEPTPVAISSDDTNAPAALDEVALRGDGDNPAITVDGVRVATDWAGVLGIE